MSPDSETNPTDQSQPFKPQDESPVLPTNPGGVVKPTNDPVQSSSTPPSPPPPPPTPLSETSPQPHAPMVNDSFNPDIPETPSTPPTTLAPSQSQPAPGAAVPPPTTSSPPSPPAVNTNEIFQPDSFGPPPEGGKKGFFNKKIALIAAPLLLVLLVSGFVFGYYIPNKPENVYKTGLDRTGDALETLLNKATDRQTYDKYKKSEIKASLDVTAGEQNIKGDFTAKFDDSKLDSKLSISFPQEGSQPVNLALSLLSEQAENKEFPDTYFNFKGIDSMGGEMLMPGISKYDGRWIAVTSDYLQSIADELGVEPPTQEGNNDKYPTFEEISSFIRDIYGVTNEHVFTSDPEKAVLINKQYLGKEDVEGTNSFHYEVGIDKDKAKIYCEAVSNTMIEHPTYKKFSGSSDEAIEEEKQKIGEDCQKSSDEIKDDETFEMWVDSKYKLIKKIRVYSEDNKGEYLELGQNYSGGDEVGLFLASTSDKGGFNSKLTFTTNLQTGESSGELTFNGGEDSNKYEGKITLSANPLTEDLTITKPENTIDIKELLKDFGINPEELVSFYGGVQSKAEDADRKVNVSTIYSHLEVHYAENAFYPTKAQLSSQSWRAANMQGLGEDVFSEAITYNPSECSSAGCQKFTLSATLSNGEKFTRTSFNN